MSARPLLVLAVVAVILGAIVMLTNRPAVQQTDSDDQLFAPQLAQRLDEVMTVRVVGAGDATIASLSRTADDWVVAQRDGYRANTNTIRSALTLLSRATVVEAKTSNPAEFSRLSVEDVTSDTAGGIALEFLPAELGLPAIILGDATGSSYRYARLSDSSQSWLINADPQVPSDITQWLDTAVLAIDGSRIERIVIEHVDGEMLDIFKSEVSQPNYSVADVPEGRTLQYPGVANVIANVLRALNLEDVATAAAEETLEVTTTFSTFDGLVLAARGYTIDGAGWLEFAADTDTQFSNPTESITAEAQSINERLSGWRYRVPDYQYGQITRRITDLLSAEESTE